MTNIKAGSKTGMIQTLQLDKWDDQELHTLFAANLPVLALPDEFAEQLTQSVLGEIAQHVQQQLLTRQEVTPEQQPNRGRHRSFQHQRENDG